MLAGHDADDHGYASVYAGLFDSLYASVTDDPRAASESAASRRTPSIDNRGRYVTSRSTCNRIPTLGNPDQSIFIWDDQKSAVSSRPSTVSRSQSQRPSCR